jgi:AraC-like DNA-binding protein
MAGITKNLSGITIALADACDAGHDAGMRRKPASYDGTRIQWDNRNVHSDRVSFGQVRYQPGGYCGPREQRDYQLVVLHSGECEARIDTSRHQLHVGYVYFYRPGHREYFRFSSKTETHHSWCSITPNFFTPAMRRELEAVEQGDVPCSESFQRILTAAFLCRLSAVRAIEGLGLALFGEFLDLVRQTRGEKTGDEPVRRAIRHMENYFGDDACLGAAQVVAGCSVNALIYKFKQETGLSPARYLWKLRAEKGIAMLAGTGLTVAEIAYKCGFKNPFHFSRLVRQHHGYPPRELRRRAWA